MEIETPRCLLYIHNRQHGACDEQQTCDLRLANSAPYYLDDRIFFIVICLSILAMDSIFRYLDCDKADVPKLTDSKNSGLSYL